MSKPKITVKGQDKRLKQRMDELTTRCADLKLAYEAARREAGRERRARQDLDTLWREVAGHFKGFNRVPVPRVPRSDLRTAAGHFSIFTDWHFGLWTRAEAMAGAIEYSSTIGHDAALDIAGRMLSDVEHERRTRQVDDAFIAVLGDMIDGMIHPDSNFGRDMTAPEAAAFAGETLGEVFDLYARAFRSVTVLMLAGNHGRTTAKPTFDHGAELSLEYLTARIASQAVKAHRHVNVIMPTDTEPVVEWRGRYWGAMHGHQIAWRNRTPIPGMEDYYDGFQTNRVNLGLPPVEMLMMGHVHQHTVCRRGRMVSFPALCGSSQYAKSLYKAIDHGAQMAFLVGDRGAFGFTQYDRRPREVGNG